MTDVVVDSSVVAKWILPEADSGQTQRVITDVATQGHRLIVLDLVFPEVANAIWKQYQRRLASLDEANQFLDGLLQCPVHVEPAAGILESGFEIATRYGRSVYDALFVALAEDLGIRGVTADEPLYRAVSGNIPGIVLLRDW